MLSSRGEVKIHEVLEKNGVNFKEEYSFNDLVASSGRALRFDFAVFDDNWELEFLIEYNGIQHYEAKSKFGGARGLFQQKYNDQKKVEYCKEHNITLVVIPYWHEQFIDYDYIMKKAYGW